MVPNAFTISNKKQIITINMQNNGNHLLGHVVRKVPLLDNFRPPGDTINVTAYHEILKNYVRRYTTNDTEC